MKIKINIFTNKNIESFLNVILSDYEIKIMKLDNLSQPLSSAVANIVVINNIKYFTKINFKYLKDDILFLSNLDKDLINFENKSYFVKTPLPINQIKNIVKNHIENIKINFHDISIVNERLTNINNKTFCYLTRVELEILCCLIKEKEISKKFVKQNILNIKSDIETNSLESHLTRIRKKLNNINTSLKLKSKNERILIST